jgi:NADPH-dependent curcumin reductase CurA
MWQDVGEVLRREYPEGIDVAYEGVGGPLRDAVLDNLSKHGRMLVVGYISEYPHVNPDDGKAEGSRGLPPAHELFWKRQTVHIDDKTIYGNVWSGVSLFKCTNDARDCLPHPCCLQLDKPQLMSGSDQPIIYIYIYLNTCALALQAKMQEIPAFRRQLFDLYEEGKLQAWVDSRRFHGVEQVSDAIDYMLTGQAVGKVVVSF